MLLNAYVDAIIDFCLPIWAVQPPQTLNLIFDKILRFLINVNYASVIRKFKRRKRCNRTLLLKFCTNEIMVKYNLLSVNERRDFQLAKFVLESKSFTLFDNWFNCSARSRNLPNVDAPNINVASSSLTYNKSIRYRGWKFWNSYSQ